MKKIIFMVLTAAFVLALGSCEQPKDKKQHSSKESKKKDKHERRW